MYTIQKSNKAQASRKKRGVSEAPIIGVSDISQRTAGRLRHRGSGHCVRVRSLRQEKTPVFPCFGRDEKCSNTHPYLFSQGKGKMEISPWKSFCNNFLLLFSTFAASRQVRRMKTALAYYNQTVNEIVNCNPIFFPLTELHMVFFN